jgi:hypothetical protein
MTALQVAAQHAADVDLHINLDKHTDIVLGMIYLSNDTVVKPLVANCIIPAYRAITQPY